MRQRQRRAVGALFVVFTMVAIAMVVVSAAAREKPQGSCANKCGAYHHDCYCDSICLMQGDCCSDIQLVCDICSVQTAYHTCRDIEHNQCTWLHGHDQGICVDNIDAVTALPKLFMRGVIDDSNEGNIRGGIVRTFGDHCHDDTAETSSILNTNDQPTDLTRGNLTCDRNGTLHSLKWPLINQQYGNRSKRLSASSVVMGTLWMPMNIYRPGDTIKGYSLLRMLEYEQQSTLTLFRRRAIKRDAASTAVHDTTNPIIDQTYYGDNEHGVVMIELRDDSNQIIRAQPLINPEAVIDEFNMSLSVHQSVGSFTLQLRLRSGQLLAAIPITIQHYEKEEITLEIVHSTRRCLLGDRIPVVLYAAYYHSPSATIDGGRITITATNMKTENDDAAATTTATRIWLADQAVTRNDTDGLYHFELICGGDSDDTVPTMNDNGHKGLTYNVTIALVDGNGRTAPSINHLIDILAYEPGRYDIAILPACTLSINDTHTCDDDATAAIPSSTVDQLRPLDEPPATMRDLDGTTSRRVHSFINHIINATHVRAHMRLQLPNAHHRRSAGIATVAATIQVVAHCFNVSTKKTTTTKSATDRVRDDAISHVTQYWNYSNESSSLSSSPPRVNNHVWITTLFIDHCSSSLDATVALNRHASDVAKGLLYWDVHIAIAHLSRTVAPRIVLDDPFVDIRMDVSQHVHTTTDGSSSSLSSPVHHTIIRVIDVHRELEEAITPDATTTTNETTPNDNEHDKPFTMILDLNNAPVTPGSMLHGMINITGLHQLAQQNNMTDITNQRWLPPLFVDIITDIIVDSNTINMSAAIWHNDNDVTIPFEVIIPNWYEGEAAIEVYIHPIYRVYRLPVSSSSWRPLSHQHFGDVQWYDFGHIRRVITVRRLVWPGDSGTALPPSPLTSGKADFISAQPSSRSSSSSSSAAASTGGMTTTISGPIELSAVGESRTGAEITIQVRLAQAYYDALVNDTTIFPSLPSSNSTSSSSSSPVWLAIAMTDVRVRANGYTPPSIKTAFKVADRPPTTVHHWMSTATRAPRAEILTVTPTMMRCDDSDVTLTVFGHHFGTINNTAVTIDDRACRISSITPPADAQDVGLIVCQLPAPAHLGRMKVAVRVNDTTARCHHCQVLVVTSSEYTTMRYHGAFLSPRYYRGRLGGVRRARFPDDHHTNNPYPRQFNRHPLHGDHVIGISIGRQNARVAVYHNGRITVIPHPWTESTTFPMFAHVKLNTTSHETDWTFGDEAFNMYSGQTRSTAWLTNITQWLDSYGHKTSARLVYERELKQKYHLLDGASVVAPFITQLVHAAEYWLGGKVKHAVMTVPAYWNDARRQAMKDAGTAAGINVMRIINEPTSIAIAHDADQVAYRKEAVYLIMDMGAQSFDVTVLVMDEGVFEILATNGAPVGGDHIDQLLTDHVVTRLREMYGFKKFSKRLLHYIRQQARQAKESASSQKGPTSIVITLELRHPTNGTMLDIRIAISPWRLDRMLEPLLTSINATLHSVLNDSGVVMKHAADSIQNPRQFASEVNHVIFAGGVSRMWWLEQNVQRLLSIPQAKILSSRSRALYDTAVVRGAAKQGGILSGASDRDVDRFGCTGSFGMHGLLLLDVSPLSIRVAVRTNDDADITGEDTLVLIERNSVMPTKKRVNLNPRSLPRVRGDRNTAVVTIVQGERLARRDNTQLAQARVRLDPLAASLRVTAEIDANGIITVTIESGALPPHVITITQEVGRLSHDEIERMVQEAEEENGQLRGRRTVSGVERTRKLDGNDDDVPEVRRRGLRRIRGYLRGTGGSGKSESWFGGGDDSDDSGNNHDYWHNDQYAYDDDDEDVYDTASTDNGPTMINVVEEKVVRTEFPDTIVMAPQPINSPIINVTLRAPDSITRYEITALVISRDDFRYVSQPLIVRNPIFTTTLNPARLTYGDSVWIRTLIENLSTATLRDINITAVTNDHITILSATQQNLTSIAPLTTVYVQWLVKAINVGTAQLNTTLTCLAYPSPTNSTDNIIQLQEISGLQKPLYISAPGQVHSHIERTSLTTRNTSDIDATWHIPFTIGADLDEVYSLGIINVLPSLQLAMIEGVESLAQYPYGCCEQTSASTYPNIIAFKYLRSVNKLTPEMEAKLLHNMHAGYERLLKFRNPTTGGFSLWEGQHGYTQPFYTALASGIIGAMKDYIEIDANILLTSKQYLERASPQGQHGAFQPAHYYGHTSQISSTAYVIHSLSIGHQYLHDSMTWILADNRRSELFGDANALAMIADTLSRPCGGHAHYFWQHRHVSQLRKLYAELLRLQLPDGSWSRGSSLSSDIETSSVALSALSRRVPYAYEAIERGVKYIMSKRTTNGWYSTRDTTLACAALSDVAAASSNNGAPLDGILEVSLNERVIATHQLTPDNMFYKMFDIRRIEIDRSQCNHGNNTIIVKWTPNLSARDSVIHVAYDHMTWYDRRTLNQSLAAIASGHQPLRITIDTITNTNTNTSSSSSSDDMAAVTHQIDITYRIGRDNVTTIAASLSSPSSLSSSSSSSSLGWNMIMLEQILPADAHIDAITLQRLRDINGVTHVQIAQHIAQGNGNGKCTLLSIFFDNLNITSNSNNSEDIIIPITYRTSLHGDIILEGISLLPQYQPELRITAPSSSLLSLL